MSLRVWLGFALATVACKPAHSEPIDELRECLGEQVCVHGGLAQPLCFASDGSFPAYVYECNLAYGDVECTEHTICQPVEVEGAGVTGLCMQPCTVVDDRPDCAPGCYNQYCAGTFELCARESGVCAPVPCAHDDDCARVAACDYPGRDAPGFVCNLGVGQCQRLLPPE